MLVLSRKEQEQIIINDSIVITIVRIDKRVVRVGIKAPPEVTIMRSELLENGNECIFEPNQEIVERNNKKHN